MKSNIKANYLYNLTYQIVALVVPLITAPYVSRILTSEGIGINSYVNSIATYFVVFANLGSAMYATRNIGINQDNVKIRSQVFFNTIAFRVLTTVIAVTLYAFLIKFSSPSNKIIYYIYILYLLNVTFDISWFFQGIEEFKFVVFRNIIIKLLNVVFIFTFVRKSSDLAIYVFGYCGFTLLGSILLWFHLPKFIKKVERINPFEGLKEMIQLFLPTLAIQVYTVLDKSMIGSITDDMVQSGAYDRSEMIVRMCLTVLSSLSAVMIPRMAKLYSDGDNTEVLNYIYKSFRYTWFVSIPIIGGLFAVSDVFVPVFLGPGYELAIIIMPIMSFICLFSGISNVLGTQFLIPIKKQNKYTFSVVSAAVLNFIMNCILIKNFGALGATIASVASECLEAFILIFLSKKEGIRIGAALNGIVNYIVGTVIMIVVVASIKRMISVNNIISLLIVVMSGVITYAVYLIAIKDPMIISVLNKVNRNK